MKKNKLFRVGMLAIALVFVVAVAGCVSYSHFQSIRNETSNTVTEVYIRDTGASDWGSVKNVQARKNSEGIILRREDGSVAYWDKITMNNSAQIVFFQETSKSETPQSITNKDIRIMDSNNVSYTKIDVAIHFNTTKSTNAILFNLPDNIIVSSDPIVFTAQDRDPIITVQNNTGYPVQIDSGTLANGGNSRFQARRETKQGNFSVNYSINDFTFSKDVDISSDASVILTERPPILTVINNTGYNTQIISPFRQAVSNGGRAVHLKQSKNINPLHVISYQTGKARFNEEVTINDADATLTLTKRPPIVTIVNNIGNTINLLQMRNPGTSWLDQNILGLYLDEDGITVNINKASTNANERSGSIVNRDNFKVYLGVVDLPMNTYDIRVDDVQGNSYVKNNVQITSDMTLTFTASDKR